MFAVWDVFPPMLMVTGWLPVDKPAGTSTSN
jgi:hypothetical protein